MEIPRDRTFDPVSAWGSDRWVAARLGSNTDWLKKNRQKLEGEGFPSVDRLFGMTLKADVDAFLAKRRRIADPAPTVARHGPENSGATRYENL